MRRGLYTFVAACLLLIAIAAAEPAFAQKQGGILKIPHLYSPASKHHEVVEHSHHRPEDRDGISM